MATDYERSRSQDGSIIRGLQANGWRRGGMVYNRAKPGPLRHRPSEDSPQTVAIGQPERLSLRGLIPRAGRGTEYNPCP